MRYYTKVSWSKVGKKRYVRLSKKPSTEMMTTEFGVRGAKKKWNSEINHFVLLFHEKAFLCLSILRPPQLSLRKVELWARSSTNLHRALCCLNKNSSARTHMIQHSWTSSRKWKSKYCSMTVAVLLCYGCHRPKWEKSWSMFEERQQKRRMKLIYLTNRSLRVAHNDDVSHVSPLESSSSVLLNQLVFVDVFFKRADSFDEPLLLDDEDELLLPPRKNPSIALPIMRASTIALRPSHFNRFSGDLCSFRFFWLGFSFELDAVAAGGSLASVNLSKVSFANVTVAWAEDFTVLGRFEAGMCRFVNQPLPEAGDLASSVTGLTPLRIDTSKLLERLDFLRLVLRSGKRNLLLLLVGCCSCGCDGATGTTGVGTSLIRFISVAEEASDESKEIKSVLVQMMPAFLEGVGAWVTLGDTSMLGFSDARRNDIDCGIGESVVDMKSEKRLLV